VLDIAGILVKTLINRNPRYIRHKIAGNGLPTMRMNFTPSSCPTPTRKFRNGHFKSTQICWERISPNAYAFHPFKLSDSDTEI